MYEGEIYQPIIHLSIDAHSMKSGMHRNKINESKAFPVVKVWGQDMFTFRHVIVHYIIGI